ncbi:MAG: class I tRNA ligase family protein [Candidatus Bathyarchaeota archaeon]
MLKLYNSLTRKLETFKPLEDGKVKLVTCGPSIYQLPHIGNYRTFVFEDILHRYLEYLGYKVERVLVITDVEDKALAEAEKQNIHLKDLADRNIETFISELKHLNTKIPDYLPRSSISVDQAVHLIEILLEKGYAYRYTHKGRKNFYFDPLKFDRFGKLFGLDMSNWPKKKRRFHRDTYTGNRWNRGDFILWHGYKEGDKVYWNTRIGKGRPSWNIQDPSMIPKSFDFKADIWCSGIDSTYRHHDYIIAVVEAVTGEPFVCCWLHAAHLLLEGEKMSKRKGNIEYPNALLEAEYTWDHIRFFFTYGHYRRKLNFTFKKYSQVCRLLESFRDMVKKLGVAEGGEQKSSVEAKKLIKQIKTDFEENMNNDLQVKAAFDSAYKTVSRLVKLKEKQMLSTEDSKEALAKLKEIDYVLQANF